VVFLELDSGSCARDKSTLCLLVVVLEVMASPLWGNCMTRGENERRVRKINDFGKRDFKEEKPPKRNHMENSRIPQFGDFLTSEN
jgi:hypothetical protein